VHSLGSTKFVKEFCIQLHFPNLFYFFVKFFHNGNQYLIYNKWDGISKWKWEVWEFFRVKRKGILLEREWGKGERVGIFRNEKKRSFVSKCFKEWGKVSENFSVHTRKWISTFICHIVQFLIKFKKENKMKCVGKCKIVREMVKISNHLNIFQIRICIQDSFYLLFCHVQKEYYIKHQITI